MNLAPEIKTVFTRSKLCTQFLFPGHVFFPINHVYLPCTLMGSVIFICEYSFEGSTHEFKSMYLIQFFFGMDFETKSRH